MENAREIVESAMKNVDPRKKYKTWSFLNYVFTGIVPYAELDLEQCNLLVSIVQEVVIGMHTAVLNDHQKSLQWAMNIASWINGAHTAHRCSQ